MVMLAVHFGLREVDVPQCGFKRVDWFLVGITWWFDSDIVILSAVQGAVILRSVFTTDWFLRGRVGLWVSGADEVLVEVDSHALDVVTDCVDSLFVQFDIQVADRGWDYILNLLDEMELISCPQQNS